MLRKSCLVVLFFAVGQVLKLEDTLVVSINEESVG